MRVGIKDFTLDKNLRMKLRMMVYCHDKHSKNTWLRDAPSSHILKSLSKMCNLNVQLRGGGRQRLFEQF